MKEWQKLTDEELASLTEEQVEMYRNYNKNTSKMVISEYGIYG